MHKQEIIRSNRIHRLVYGIPLNNKIKDVTTIESTEDRRAVVVRREVKHSLHILDEAVCHCQVRLEERGN